ncbi:MAG: T9SS type A sorting domain-containing protein [Crocinitomicaceae bacterium]|nr:T9SS type A sorting domain-containing protein [Crocinitomicaceae bacterium]
MKTTLLLTLSLLAITSYTQINLDSGLVAHYAFEGNGNDSSPNAFHGAVSNVTYSVGVYGAPNSSALFNGSDSSYIDCGPDNRGISDTIAISAFIRTTFNGIGDVVSKYDPGNDRGYHLQLSLGKIRFAGRDGGGNYRSTGFSLSTINDSLWHHVLGVVRGNTWLLYIDCSLEGAQSNATVGPDISSNAELGIGKDVFGNAKFLDCEVDEVRIYNRELWPDEMDSLCATAVFAEIETLPNNLPHIQVYPNPAQNEIAIVADQSLENANIAIYDLSGKRVLSVVNNTATALVNVSDLQQGNYIIHITQSDQVFTSKFVKL